MGNTWQIVQHVMSPVVNSQVSTTSAVNPGIYIALSGSQKVKFSATLDGTVSDPLKSTAIESSLSITYSNSSPPVKYTTPASLVGIGSFNASNQSWLPNGAPSIETHTSSILVYPNLTVSGRGYDLTLTMKFCVETNSSCSVP